MNIWRSAYSRCWADREPKKFLAKLLILQHCKCSGLNTLGARAGLATQVTVPSPGPGLAPLTAGRSARSILLCVPTIAAFSDRPAINQTDWFFYSLPLERQRKTL